MQREQLADHQCINLRLPTSGGFYAWEFEKGGREMKVRVDGQLAFNELPLSIRVARAGLGIAFVPDDIVQADVGTGRVVGSPRPRLPGLSNRFAITVLGRSAAAGRRMDSRSRVMQRL
jgi:DNA-binding transcriptional LysR family regulator